MIRENISAIERLRALPLLFRGAEVTVRFSWTSKTASQYLYRWKSQGLIDALGGHSDVFANLLGNPSPDWELATKMAMPSGIIVGIEALRRAGWTTQIPTLAQIAVNTKERVFDGIRRFDIQPRSPGWFAMIEGGIDRQPGALATLRPAWALADMLASEGWGVCGLDPDDIDVSLASSRDRGDWNAAREVFGLPENVLPELERVKSRFVKR